MFHRRGNPADQVEGGYGDLVGCGHVGERDLVVAGGQETQGHDEL